jgi:hypothetical protein
VSTQALKDHDWRPWNKTVRVWCLLELIAEVHFEVHCVLNLGFLGVVETSEQSNTPEDQVR